MSLGPSYTTTTPELSQEQKDQIAAQTGFFTGTVAPTYKSAVEGATNLYNITAPGALEAAQNVAGTAGQAQQALGSTGESALRTGISGLESLFSPDYESKQITAALAPAQAQYLQNVQDMNARFGATGNLGSAREALAGRQLAGSNQMNQALIAAQVEKDIAAQRQGVGSTLAQLGQGGIGQAVGAAQTKLGAATSPVDLYNKYASIIFGTPSAAYNPDFRGTQGTTTTSIKANLNPFAGL